MLRLEKRREIGRRRRRCRRVNARSPIRSLNIYATHSRNFPTDSRQIDAPSDNDVRDCITDRCSVMPPIRRHLSVTSILRLARNARRRLPATIQPLNLSFLFHARPRDPRARSSRGSRSSRVHSEISDRSRVSSGRDDRCARYSDRRLSRCSSRELHSDHFDLPVSRIARDLNEILFMITLLSPLSERRVVSAAGSCRGRDERVLSFRSRAVSTRGYLLHFFTGQRSPRLISRDIWTRCRARA